jgi:hypothetical protein
LEGSFLLVWATLAAAVLAAFTVIFSWTMFFV